MLFFDELMVSVCLLCIELEDVLGEFVVVGCVIVDSFVGLCVLLMFVVKCDSSWYCCLCWYSFGGIEDVGCWLLVCVGVLCDIDDDV